MKVDIVNDTVKELMDLGIGATLSNVVVTRTYTGPWTLSYVTYDDGAIGCGIANNEMKVPDEVSFVRNLIGVDVYDVIHELDGVERSLFTNSLRVSIASALSYKLMNDERSLEGESYTVKTALAPDFSPMDPSEFVKGTDVVATVGFHVTLTPLLANIAKEVNVTELMDLQDLEVIDFNPRKSNVKIFPVRKTRQVLSQANVVYITGETVVNDTLDKLLEFSRNARTRVIYGPTSSFYPKALFNRGIDASCAIVLPNTLQFRDQFIRSRGWWQGIKGVKILLIKETNNGESIQ